MLSRADTKVDLIIMDLFYSRNNNSLCAIPNNIKYGLPCQFDKLKVASNHLFINDDIFSTPYQLVVEWNFKRDPRGYYRAFRKNGWMRGEGIIILQNGVRVSPEIEALIRRNIINRIKRCLGYRDLKGRDITRYRFNYLCTFPFCDLKGKDAHHKIQDNKIIRKVWKKKRLKVKREWLVATDDRIQNLEVLTPTEHQTLHINKSDYKFFDYRTNSECIKDMDNLHCENESNLVGSSDLGKVGELGSLRRCSRRRTIPWVSFNYRLFCTKDGKSLKYHVGMHSSMIISFSNADIVRLRRHQESTYRLPPSLQREFRDGIKFYL